MAFVESFYNANKHRDMRAMMISFELAICEHDNDVKLIANTYAKQMHRLIELKSKLSNAFINKSELMTAISLAKYDLLLSEKKMNERKEALRLTLEEQVLNEWFATM